MNELQKRAVQRWKEEIKKDAGSGYRKPALARRVAAPSTTGIHNNYNKRSEKVKKKNEIFASLFDKVPKNKRKQAMIEMYPSLVEIQRTLHKAAGDEEWLESLKEDYEGLTVEEKLERLFR